MCLSRALDDDDTHVMTHDTQLYDLWELVKQTGQKITKTDLPRTPAGNDIAIYRCTTQSIMLVMPTNIIAVHDVRKIYM